MDAVQDQRSSQGKFSTNKDFSRPSYRDFFKRWRRSQCVGQIVTAQRCFGHIKYYLLPKRFGFVTMEGEKKKVFICEDDLVLSGVDLSYFKNQIYQRNRMKLSFEVANYLANGIFKQKAVRIALEV